ncbi:Leucine-rich repeat [Trypanosoma melophagium]|uniref:Leucine-rich repeat n=1 Tax=Trypanosoma melophagium TaxID=715481 RepID=UPI00351AAE16|nr:Leucine-rich repeat [Trypanosoma melophagium]
MVKKKEKIPPPGTPKDPTTNFFTRRKWKALLLSPLLELQGRNIIPRGALIIGTALMKNRHVVRLDLSQNHIGDDGAVTMAEVLRKNESIQHLNLAQNDITDVGGIALASAFIPNVNPNGQPGQWNRTLFTLVLAGNQLGDATLVAMSKAAACHRDLSRVDLSWNNIGPMGTKGLMRSMQRNPLCTYNLMANHIGDEGTTHLCEALKHYAGKGTSTLNLFRNDVRHRGCKAVGQLLENNEFILDVCLHSNTLGLKGTQVLCHHFLAAPNHVRSLSLANCMLGNDGALEVAALIAASPPLLERLSIAGNNITDEGGAAIMKALLKNTGLIMINCAENTFGAKTVEYTLEVIRTATVLKLIDFTKSLDSTEMRRTLAYAANDANDIRVELGDVQEETLDDVLQRIAEHMQIILENEAEKAKNKKLRKKSKKE